ncbi:hypothetical protein [Nocardiopsis lucentensis]|uniref:hypothetical protein n=1 Tax=Nocardiopsis lucentensis TaxID=53441 RepID=UPI001269082F|nr:hypothetical protein [Nocardiopsis lucentensis]
MGDGPVAHGGGYRLDVPSGELDAHAFERLVAEGSRLLREHPPAGRRRSWTRPRHVPGTPPGSPPDRAPCVPPTPSGSAATARSADPARDRSERCVLTAYEDLRRALAAE